MNLHTAARDLADLWVEMKRGMCEDGPADLFPMLEVAGARRCGGMLLDTTSIAAAVSLLARESSGVDAVFVMTDAYTRLVEDGEPIPARGSLAEAFDRGDMTVGECLVVTARDVRGDEVTLQIPYRYDDEGHPVFDAPSEAEMTTDLITEQLRAIVGAS